MQFAVFTKRNGAWKLWADFGAHRSGAFQERDYLVGSLGVDAQVFQRVAA